MKNIYISVTISNPHANIDSWLSYRNFRADAATIKGGRDTEHCIEFCIYKVMIYLEWDWNYYL